LGKEVAERRSKLADPSNRNIEGDTERRCLKVMNALERRRHRLDDGRIVGDGFPFVLRRHDLLRREELDPRDAPGAPIEDDVAAAERLAARKGLDDANL